MLMFTLLVLGLAWTVNATPVGNHTCPGVVKHPVTVRVNVTEPVTFRTYTWCLRVPPRCSQYTIQLKDRIKIHTEMHNRTITVCCAGYVEIDFTCVPACPPQADCPNMHCNRTNHCYCTPGYTGLYCNQPCPKGSWGPACQKPCDCPPGYTCHHLTGDCMLDDGPSSKPKRTTVMTIEAEQSHISTSLPSSSTASASTTVASTTLHTTTQAITTTKLSTETPTSKIRLITSAPSSINPIPTTIAVTTTSMPSSTASTVTLSTPFFTEAMPSTTQIPATIPPPVASTTPKTTTFLEPLTSHVTTTTPAPPSAQFPSTVLIDVRTTNQGSILSETHERTDFFAPTKTSRTTKPSLEEISTEPVVSTEPFVRTPPAVLRVPVSIAETPPSITEEPLPSSTALTEPAPTIASTPSIAVSSTTVASPETAGTTLFVPFWMKFTPPSPTLEGLKTETTVTRVMTKPLPNMHIISKTSDGRFILTNVVDTSSNRNATTKKPFSFTSTPSTLLNIPLSSPTTTTSSVKISSPSTENARTSNSPTSSSPVIPDLIKLLEHFPTFATRPPFEGPLSTASTSPISLSTTVPTPTLFSSSFQSTTMTKSEKSRTFKHTEPTQTSTTTEISKSTPSTILLVPSTQPPTTKIQNILNTTTALENEGNVTTSVTTNATDIIKTYLPKFSFDKDESLEITKTPQKPMKTKEKIQKKYKSKVDAATTLSTFYPSSRKEIDENLTNNVFLETTEFKVHLTATNSMKNSETPVRKATTKLEVSEDDSDSSRLYKKKIKDKLAKVSEETTPRPPITLLVSTSTGVNAAHTWYSHMREKAKAKSTATARQPKTTTPMPPTETSPVAEESNDIDSLAAMYTAAQDSKNGNSLQDEFSLLHTNNVKFNNSLVFSAGVQAARSSSFGFYSSITAVVGGCLILLACSVLVTLLLFRLRNKRRAANGNATPSEGDDVRAYETVYPVHELPVTLEAVTFFCPTFTNNYAENMKRDASEFNYDQPKNHASEPLYAEIRH